MKGEGKKIRNKYWMRKVRKVDFKNPVWEIKKGAKTNLPK